MVTLGMAISLLTSVLLVVSQTAKASGNDCTVSFRPETSGFKLNPILDKLVVATAEPKTPHDVCVLQPGDEILRVNEQVVVGSRALSVQKYWKSLEPHAPVTFRVRRAGSELTLLSK